MRFTSANLASRHNFIYQKLKSYIPLLNAFFHKQMIKA